MTYEVWTDGSCKHGLDRVPRGLLGWGGWAAIVEYGSDGVALRGRVPQTTNTRMELLAAVEGLRYVPEGEPVRLYTDCETVRRVYTLNRGNDLRGLTSGDADLWYELALEYDRHPVTVVMLYRGTRPAQHKRAHVIAGAEARAGLTNLPINAQPFTPSRKDRKRARSTAIARAFGKHHSPACTQTMCFVDCPVWRARNPHIAWDVLDGAA